MGNISNYCFLKIKILKGGSGFYLYFQVLIIFRIMQSDVYTKNTYVMSPIWFKGNKREILDLIMSRNISLTMFDQVMVNLGLVF